MIAKVRAKVNTFTLLFKISWLSSVKDRAMEYVQQQTFKSNEKYKNSRIRKEIGFDKIDWSVERLRTSKRGN